VHSGTRIALEDVCHDKITEYSDEKQVINGETSDCFLGKELFSEEGVVFQRRSDCCFSLEVAVSEGDMVVFEDVSDCF
jgi:hypothetical protein